ncbi:hypothetical protein CORC01_13074 [Colletotrichum orchidophilum]|uniref:Uncharacterized protein n=1 Tax=Colletotrichum orchidophilum TaxID=1209926 RepID=A0A1G4AR45_9PEZI|nr:uncharacterized protein CORC01_13074 [Colletotrichum orchidophilum]OHE91638.1 hypothetical protein CORC01_13074 [Colletotrichum orchidophilum]
MRAAYSSATPRNAMERASTYVDLRSGRYTSLPQQNGTGGVSTRRSGSKEKAPLLSAVSRAATAGIGDSVCICYYGSRPRHLPFAIRSVPSTKPVRWTEEENLPPVTTNPLTDGC